MFPFRTSGFIGVHSTDRLVNHQETERPAERTDPAIVKAFPVNENPKAREAGACIVL